MADLSPNVPFVIIIVPERSESSWYCNSDADQPAQSITELLDYLRRTLPEPKPVDPLAFAMKPRRR